MAGILVADGGLGFTRGLTKEEIVTIGFSNLYQYLLEELVVQH